LKRSLLLEISDLTRFETKCHVTASIRESDIRRESEKKDIRGAFQLPVEPGNQAVFRNCQDAIWARKNVRISQQSATDWTGYA
jgi:hypothetical protein